MNIENNLNNYSLKPEKMETKMEPDKSQKLIFVLEKCKELLCEAAQRRMPENGKFSKFSIEFEVPETDNHGVLTIDFDANNPRDGRILSVGVHHKNSDRLISNILLTGTKKEILDKLASSEDMDELIEIVSHLSDKTDDYYSSL